jgi:hypothetical protein
MLIRHPSDSPNSTQSSNTPNSPDSVSGRPLPLGSTLSRHPVYVTTLNQHPADVTNSVSSRHSFSSSDSVPGRPPSRILDSMSGRHSSSSSDDKLSRDAPNSPNSVSDHPPSPDITLGRHLAYVADNVSNRRTPISPASIPILQPPILQLPLLQLPPPISMSILIHHSSSSSGGTLNHHMFNSPDSVSSHLPPPDTTASCDVPYIPNAPYVPDMSYIPNVPYVPDMPYIPNMSYGHNVAVIPDMSSSDPSIKLPIRPLFHIPSNMPSSYSFGGFYEMQISMKEDFRGIGMEHHRADLLQRLDLVIRQLDLGLEYFKKLDPKFDEDYLQRSKHQYQYLREILLEANITSDQPYVSFNDHATPSAHSCS